MQKYKKEDIFSEFYDQNCDEEFSFNKLPKSSIKWYEEYNNKDSYNIAKSLNASPVKGRFNNIDTNLLLAPNGYFKRN